MDIVIILLVTLGFVVVKATGVVGWAWYWVFSPIWIGIPAISLLALAHFVYKSFE